MEEKQIEALKTLKQELEDTLKTVESLSEERKFFYNTGTICVEMSKQEIIQLLKAEIEEVEKMLKGEKNE